MNSVIKTKSVGNEKLTLSSYVSDHDFPGKTCYWLELESGVGFLGGPDCGTLSLPFYELIFDKINSEEDFQKLKEEIGKKVSGLYRIVKPHKEPKKPQVGQA